jgi:hypothetical protein
MRVFLAIGAVVALVPAVAFAQEGQIAGTARDTSGAVMPGVTVEVTSPALIEKVRSATTDSSGQYRITALPVGSYTVTFTLSGFASQKFENVVLTTGFTAPVNATMAVGGLAESVTVTGVTPAVDVQNARQAITFEGDQLKELPTSRNITSLLNLTPGISSNYQSPTSSSPFGAPGICVGGIGVFCNPGVSGFNVGDTTDVAGNAANMAQGRVMVDGVAINAPLPIVGQTGGYTADIASAQEVNIQLSGALGDSETGGASINIIPRTGGNRFAGDFNFTYTRDNWFDRNTAAYGLPAVFQAVISDHDVSGSFGGPIRRDQLWFYSVGRDQGIHKLPVGVDWWPNLHEGKWGYNYQPDRSQPRVEYKNKWRNVNTRITWQASQKNKFNIFWDEQDFCQDPCDGVVSVYTSPESWWSVQVRPNRLQTVSWTNPLSNKILLEAGLTAQLQFYDTTEHRQFTNPRSIPRVMETGDTVGADSVAPRVNQFAGGAFFIATSGSLNSRMAAGGAEQRDSDNYRSRASISYVTGTHNAKFGYDGASFRQRSTNAVNDLQQTYNYVWPAATCATTAPLETFPCGNTSLQFPEDPFNLGRRPVPQTVEYNTGVGTTDDRVRYHALYAQDQWTLRRFTVSGALRFDHASSGYGETCVGPNQFVPVQANGQNRYCTPETDGVSYNDLTPRFGVTYDLFGTGKTSLKFNGGKYLTAAGITGIYSNANPARRTVNHLVRNWNDANGNRRVDCDLMNFTPNGECGTFTGAGNDTVRFGRDPFQLDAAGVAPIGLQTTQCGRTEQGIPAAVQAYCAAYGDSLLEGWGTRQNEWQFGLGIQHEILPRLSGEFTYNRRMYGNLLTSDTLNIGCDRFGGVEDMRACQEGYLNYVSRTHDFYTVVAPTDPRLPNGGGYTILGLNSDKVTQPVGQPVAQTLNPDLEYTWNGFDTNFVWRGPRGIRVNGGTSTSRTQRNTCYASLDGPNVRGRDGAEYQAGCDSKTPWRTNLRGTASYLVPWADVLVSTVFQMLPGAEIGANLTYSKEQIRWNPESASRATEPCSVATNGVGCLGATRNTTTVSVPLLLSNEMFGERVSLFDVKLAKNIRFYNKRATIGVDIYNVMNSDAIQGYNGTFTVDNPATPAVEANNWMQPTSVVSPRFVRLSMQLSF